MCSRLALVERGNVRPGDRVLFVPHSGDPMEGQWGYMSRGRYQGFARLETLQKSWLSRGYQTGTVEIAGFSEGHANLIDCNQLSRVAAVERNGTVLIVTRQASDTERARFNHHRVPARVVGGHIDKSNWEV
jgi:hypothetical protein